MIKRIRSMPSITLPVLRVGEKYEVGKTLDLRTAKFPLHCVNSFIRLLEDQPSEKRRRFHLLEKHKELFECYPDPGVGLEIVRARCCYRLQFLGHQQTGTKPSASFLKNYSAIMKFAESEPWNGCTRIVAELGKLLSLSEGEVSMSAVKATKQVAKKIAKAAKPAKAKSAGGRQTHKILNKYGVTHIITWMAKQWDITADQIATALNRLGSSSTERTIRTYMRPGLTKKNVKQVDAADANKIKAAVPPAKKEAKVMVKPVPKAVKKIVKKIVKATPVTA